METFSEFKNHFYSRISDFSIFDCQDFNILKVVLDGLKVDYVRRGTYNTNMFKSSFFYNLYLSAKRNSVSNKKLNFNLLKQFSKKEYLIIDPGRFKKDENNQFVSSYFYNFYNKLKSYVSISDVSAHANLFHFFANDLSAELQFEALTAEEKVLRKELLKTYSRIKNAEVFSSTELENIKIAICQFFKKYREWDRVLKVLQPKQSFFVSHYHKEGALLALKRNKIKAIELQHGLIAPEDIFYMFPSEIKSVKERALFADEIWVYGEFWKQRLLKGAEYDLNQIKIFGYYMHENKVVPELIDNKLKELKGNKKIILITTQDKHPKEITKYIQFLSKDIQEKKYNYCIWIKPHPAEKKDAFNGLEDNVNVFILEDNLDYLFKYADMMLSIYSTTLYDACRYNLPAFALFADSCADYVNSIVASGVAVLIQENQNPIDLLDKSPQKNDPKFYFDECNYSMLGN